MRYWLLVLVLALLPVCALAEDGHQAKFNVQFSVGDEMKAAIAQSGGDAAAADGMVPEPITGQMWWTAKNMRMEITFPMMGEGGEPFTGILLIDLAKNLMYVVDSSTKEAAKVDLNDAAQAAGAPGLIGANPSELVGDWKKNIDSLKERGVAVKELGQVSLNGTSCQHYTFEVDATKLQEDPAASDDTSLAGMLGTFGGEVWMAESTGMPVKLTTNIMGMALSYELSDIKAWQEQAGFFEVPAGYNITTMDEMTQEATPEAPAA
jgi:hypothetical protein